MFIRMYENNPSAFFWEVGVVLYGVFHERLDGEWQVFPSHQTLYSRESKISTLLDSNDGVDFIVLLVNYLHF